MKRIHRHTRLIEGTVYLIDIGYLFSEANQAISIERMTVHPIRMGGMVGPNVIGEPNRITDRMQEDAMNWMKEDGLIS